MGYVLYVICKYWYADTLYATGKAYNGVQRPDEAIKYLGQAIGLTPGEALYHNEIAGSFVNLKNSNLAIQESDKAILLSPANVNLKRTRFGVFINLATDNPNLLQNAKETLIDAINLAPTDAKLFYNLGLVYARLGDQNKALETLQKTVGLKPNYKDARLAYAFLLADGKQIAEAKEQLIYILKNIDPTDPLTTKTLESLK